MTRVITEMATAIPEAAGDIRTTGNGNGISDMPSNSVNVALGLVQISAPIPNVISEKIARVPV